MTILKYVIYFKTIYLDTKFVDNWERGIYFRMWEYNFWIYSD